MSRPPGSRQTSCLSGPDPSSGEVVLMSLAACSIVGVAMAAALATGIALLSLIAAVSFRTGIRIPKEIPKASVTLIMAATGTLPDLEVLFTALMMQTLRPTRLVIAVESQEDPAYDRVAELAPRYPALEIELVVAGVSNLRAQKLTNLLAALARLDKTDEYVVTFDADIRPQPWWLATLVAPLAAGRADIVNGYRWQLPRIVSPATIIGAAIDRAIAVLPRPTSFRMLWGGSIAFTRSALEAVEPVDILARALTEDLTIADKAIAVGLRVRERSALRLPTPLDGNLAQLWRFARRQYQIIHLYRRGVWRFACGVTTADLFARIGLVAAVMGDNLITVRMALASLISLGLLGSAVVEIRRKIGSQLGAIDPRGFTFAYHFVVWSTLPIAAFHAGAIWASARRSPVTWGHVRYVVNADGQVTNAERSPHRDASE